MTHWPYTDRDLLDYDIANAESFEQVGRILETLLERITALEEAAKLQAERLRAAEELVKQLDRFVQPKSVERALAKYRKAGDKT